MIKYCIRISLPVLLFVSTFIACSAPEVPNLDSWLKKYTYQEDPVAEGEDFLMVMSWDLTISKNSDNKYLGDLAVNGQQTAMNISGDVVGDQQAVAFVYASAAEGTTSTFQPGDTLFILKRTNNTITTQWHAAKPMLRENPPPTCNCFQ